MKVAVVVVFLVVILFINTSCSNTSDYLSDNPIKDSPTEGFVKGEQDKLEVSVPIEICDISDTKEDCDYKKMIYNDLRGRQNGKS